MEGKTLRAPAHKPDAAAKKFIRYKEGAEMYSVSTHTFMKLASDADAVYKVGRVSLVSTEILDRYLESYRE